MKRWPSTGCNVPIILADTFDALLFDMDGLLLDTERLFMETLVSLTGPLGLAEELTRRFFLGLIGTSAAHTTARMAEFLPDHVDPAAFDAEWRAANRARRADRLPLRPGAAEMIPHLHTAGHRMAIVTSTKRAPALDHLARADLLSYFEIVVAGDDVPANKPDPAPYLQAAARLGVDPRRCAAFEDSDTGTRAAVAAGCLTTQIPDLRPDVPLPRLGQRIAPDLTRALYDLGLVPQTDTTP